MPSETLQLLKDAGLIGALVWFIWGGIRGTWLFSRHHDEVVRKFEERLSDLEADRDFWRQSALDAIGTAKQGVDLAERRQR